MGIQHKHYITDEVKEEIIRLCKTGLSQGKVGKLLGVTKNTVAGQWNRYKERGFLLKKIRTPKGPNKFKKMKLIPDEIIITSEGVTIFELKNDSCRAMIGHHKYCGHKSHNRSYCLTHYKEYYQPKQRKAK